MKQIGKIISVHGVKGALTIRHDLPAFEDVQKMTVFMVELLPGSMIPFFILDMQETLPGEAIIQFEEIDNREQAVTLTGKLLYLPPHLQIDLPDQHHWQHMIGFTLLDQVNNNVGLIEDVYENGSQVWFVVLHEAREILIPVSDELIVSINQSIKTITLDIADGLLEI